MRVISQDGTMDFPYENSIVFIDTRAKDAVFVRMQAIGDDEASIMADYSTKEKAKKAMEMLRDAYLSRMELDGGYDAVSGCYVQPNFWVLPKVFQFPKDEDVEV